MGTMPSGLSKGSGAPPENSRRNAFLMVYGTGFGAD
jgi:hypothetical protein